jgi:DNA-directed RNA polymerase subunit E"
MACRKCKHVTTEKVCPSCKSSDLTPDWNGVVLIVDPSNSKIADTLKITSSGKYAIKVT